MKKLMTACVFGSAMALSACVTDSSTVDYSYEKQAPYADERTVGSMGEEEVVVVAPAKAKVETKTADRMYDDAQRK